LVLGLAPTWDIKESGTPIVLATPRITLAISVGETVLITNLAGLAGVSVLKENLTTFSEVIPLALSVTANSVYWLLAVRLFILKITACVFPAVEEYPYSAFRTVETDYLTISPG